MKESITVKKILVLFLIASMLCASFAEDAAEPLFSTIAQAIEADEDAFCGWNNGNFVAIVKIGDRFIRAVAAVDEAVLEKYDAIEATIDYNNIEDFMRVDAEMDELGKSLPVAYTEDITGAILDQAALDAMAGKSVSELEEEEYTLESYYSNDITGEVIVELSYGMFQYECVMNESIETYQLLYETDELGKLTVKSAQFYTFGGNALDLRYHADGTHDPIEDDVDLSDFNLLDVLDEAMKEQGLDFDIGSLFGGLGGFLQGDGE